MGCGSSSASGSGEFGTDMNSRDSKHGDIDHDDFFECDEAVGEQATSSVPWKGQIAEPTNHNDINPAQPDEKYELEYVYGYRSADSKQNCHFNSEGNAVYMTAALGVILSPGDNTQKFFGGGEVAQESKMTASDFSGHTNDVLCCKVNNARDTAVTGQNGSQPVLFTWCSVTGAKKGRAKLPKGSRGITACSFNRDGSKVACVDAHNDHRVYVFTTGGAELAQFGMEKGGGEKIHDICFDPNGDGFTTAGVKHFYFWNAADASLDKKKGIYNGNPQGSFACTAWDDKGRAYSGSTKNDIYVWQADNRTCIGRLEGHTKGMIGALKFDAGKLYSGGKDGCVITWDCSGDGLPAIGAKVEFNDLIRSIDVFNGNMLVGTRDGSIWHGAAGEKGNAIMTSHSDGEVWGLDTCGVGNSGSGIMTSGDDNKVIIWDTEKRTQHQCVQVSNTVQHFKRGASTLSNLPASQQSRAVACNGTVAVISTNCGFCEVRSGPEYNEVGETLTDPKEWNQCISFSPDGSMCAVGSHDNNVYIYKTDDWTLKSTCKGHSSFIIALDWCTHNKYIRTNSGDYELLFWTAEDGAQDPSGKSNTVGVEWATSTVKFGWNVEGIFPRGTDGTHINAVAGNTEKTLIACGDDFGLVTLFRDPVRKGHKPRAYRGHSEHVTNVKFSADGTYLWSAGGYDQTVMQWKKC